jgi:hypothetical protein
MAHHGYAPVHGMAPQQEHIEGQDQQNPAHNADTANSKSQFTLKPGQEIVAEFM